MIYFLDCEFMERPGSIELVSLGLVREDGHSLYAVNRLMNKVSLFDDPWMVQNVVPHLPFHKVHPSRPWSYSNFDEDYSDPAWMTPEQIRDAVFAFVAPGPEKPQFYGYYADYDWVVFCWLFGRMIDLPKHFPKYCRDIKQELDDHGNPRVWFEPAKPHHALHDAEYVREMHRWLRHDCPTQETAERFGYKLGDSMVPKQKTA